ncbi:hypothetical protein BDV18DRAFT_129070 [Aspergillus unguis]
MFPKLRDLAMATLAIQSLPEVPAAAAANVPAPELSYLYTAFVHCKETVMSDDGPRGTRRAIPIVGGNFTGPRLSGIVNPMPHGMPIGLSSLIAGEG